MDRLSVGHPLSGYGLQNRCGQSTLLSSRHRHRADLQGVAAEFGVSGVVAYQLSHV